MFERVFNRLGHGSVVEKNRGRRRGRLRGRRSRIGRRLAYCCCCFYFTLFIYFFFKINRFVGRMGDVREVWRIEIEGNGEKKEKKKNGRTRGEPVGPQA